MSKYKHGNVTALREYMLQGNKVTILEAMLLFGVQAFNRSLTTMKRDGYIIKKEKVSMIKVLRRVNELAACKPPEELPAKEVLMTEYWISQ